jgi:aminocarboxymuconate-semialdehyde decarboxylase
MLIDVHTHLVPNPLPNFSGRKGGASWPTMEPVNAHQCRVMIAGKNFRTVTDACWSPQRRVEDMEREGVARQVVSPMPELFSYWLDGRDTLDFSRFINEALAQWVRAQPERFYGLGQVPLQDPHLAAKEIAEIKRMGLHGVEIGSNVNGKSLASPEFLEFFQEAQAQRCPIFIHALKPQGTERFTGPPVLNNLIGFPQENALAAATLITGGVMERCPDLRVLFSHGGSGFMIVLPRLDQGWHTMEKFLPQPPSSYAGNFYFDSLLFDPLAIRHLVDRFGSQRVMVGSDYPFAIREKPVGKHVREMVGLSPEQLADLLSRSCLSFLGLPSGIDPV